MTRTYLKNGSDKKETEMTFATDAVKQLINIKEWLGSFTLAQWIRVALFELFGLCLVLLLTDAPLVPLLFLAVLFFICGLIIFQFPMDDIIGRKSTGKRM